MDLNKIPRWALILFATVGLAACTTMVSTARADLDKFKSIAEAAQNTSTQNTVAIVELKESIKEIRGGQEQFRREYREDQKGLDSKLGELLRAVKQ